VIDACKDLFDIARSVAAAMTSLITDRSVSLTNLGNADVIGIFELCPNVRHNAHTSLGKGRPVLNFDCGKNRPVMNLCLGERLLGPSYVGSRDSQTPVRVDDM
jgi:hypothetical protein